jgi:hypothetical protein
MSESRYADLFPIAMGNEEESMLMTGDLDGPLADPTDFVSRFGRYIPVGIRRVPGRQVFLQNGGLLYDGGASWDNSEEYYFDNVNLERATPECADPEELARYTGASEALYVQMLTN